MASSFRTNAHGDLPLLLGLCHAVGDTVLQPGPGFSCRFLGEPPATGRRAALSCQPPARRPCRQLLLAGGDPSTGTVATEETRSESELLFLPEYLILSSCETGRLHHARYALRPTVLACLLHTCSRRLPRAGRFAPASSRGCVCRDRDPYQPLQRPKHVAHQTK